MIGIRYDPSHISLSRLSANDGLLPKWFGELDATGNAKKGALFAGGMMTIFATFIPFSYLDDFVSAGILIAFTVTNCSLVIMRRDSLESNPYLLQKLLASYNLFAFLTCLAFTHSTTFAGRWTGGIILGGISICITTKISRQCPPSQSFGGVSSKSAQIYGNKKYFSTPWIPYLPCLGMFANYFLISQLSWFGIGLLFLYTLILILVYFMYGAHNSVGRLEGWEQEQYAMVDEHEHDAHVPGRNAVIT